MDSDGYVVFRERQTNYGHFPAFYTYSYLVEDRALRFGCKITEGISILNGGNKAILSTKQDIERIKKYLLGRALKEKNYVSNIKARSDAQEKILLKFLKDQIITRNMKKLSNRQLSKIYADFVKYYINFCYENITPWLLLPDPLQEKLKEILRKKCKPEELMDNLTVLTTPTAPSFINKEEEDLIALVLLIKKTGAGKVLTHGFKSFPDINKLLAKQVNQYHWIPFDYLGPKIWGKAHYIKEIIKKLNEEYLEERLRELKEHEDELKRKQEELKCKLKLTSEQYGLFKDMQTLTLLQDQKKAVCTKAHIPLQTKLLPEISKRTGISQAHLRNMLHKEIADALEGRPIDQDNIKQRSKLSVVIKDKKGYTILIGKEAEDFAKQFEVGTQGRTEIRGIAASLGKAKGHARIVKNVLEISKVKDGDILITPMTTPDYVPVLKKVSAIITDEGGITCHAAIVSRELGIPCIIATNIATKAFKDDDLVEVDADKGIVRLCPKSLLNNRNML